MIKEPIVSHKLDSFAMANKPQIMKITQYKKDRTRPILEKMYGIYIMHNMPIIEEIIYMVLIVPSEKYFRSAGVFKYIVRAY